MAADSLSLSTPVADAEIVANYIREGRFQRSLALLTGLTSVVNGLEVAYEHYRGSYSRRVMYAGDPERGARGGRFRGVLQPKDGTNVSPPHRGDHAGRRGCGILLPHPRHRSQAGRLAFAHDQHDYGPPIFAPLLFGTSAYLGLIASFLQREDAKALENGSDAGTDTWLARLLPSRGARAAVHRAGHAKGFQQQLAVITGVSALLSGFETYHSHYKNNFRYKGQWSPVIIAPLLAAVAFASVASRRIAVTALPALSAVASADAAVGFYFHARGVLRRPGGMKHLVYNILYGPPIFAPLLFGAAGMLGFMASLLRRRKS